MSIAGGARYGKTVPGHQNLTPNERAVIERVRSSLLRRVVESVWRLKLRLQFTGWLQYLPPLTLIIVFFLLGGLIRLLGARLVAGGFAAVGYLLLIGEAFDLITVKFRLRPREPRPVRRDEFGLFDLMRARRSCRSFQTRKIESSDYTEMAESVRRHSGEARFGTSPVRIEYVSSQLTVWPTVNAVEFLVAIAPLDYDRLAIIDVGRTLQKIVMDATRMGLGTCWIGPGADHRSVISSLGSRFDPETDHIVCVCAIGYKSAFIPMFVRVFNAQFHRRLPLSSLFFRDMSMTEPLDTASPPFAIFGRTYEICQWSPSSYNGQTTRCVAVTRGDVPVRFDFFAVTESRYYCPVALGIWCANWELGCEALGIRGHFAVLTAGERGAAGNETQAPRYDVSWILDDRPV